MRKIVLIFLIILFSQPSIGDNSISLELSKCNADLTLSLSDATKCAASYDAGFKNYLYSANPIFAIQAWYLFGEKFGIASIIENYKKVEEKVEEKVAEKVAEKVEEKVEEIVEEKVAEIVEEKVAEIVEEGGHFFANLVCGLEKNPLKPISTEVMSLLSSLGVDPSNKDEINSSINTKTCACVQKRTRLRISPERIKEVNREYKNSKSENLFNESEELFFKTLSVTCLI